MKKKTKEKEEVTKIVYGLMNKELGLAQHFVDTLKEAKERLNDCLDEAVRMSGIPKDIIKNSITMRIVKVKLIVLE